MTLDVKENKIIFQMRRAILSIILVPLLAGVISCSKGSSGEVRDYTWTQAGPDGGFVSSVTFHPTGDEIWASGDDGSGLYRSDDGVSWNPVTSAPKDQATYSLRIDPTDPLRIYAPNHFGRGFLYSDNGGTTWTLGGNGLPVSGAARRFYDLAIDPANTSVLFACLEGGLFKSDNNGAMFTQVTSTVFASDVGTDVDFRTVVIDSARVVVGSASGNVYYSTTGGDTWSKLTTTNYYPVTSLALTANALYIGFSDGTITRTTSFTPGIFDMLNIGNGADDIESGLWTRLAALSGATVNADVVYVGTTVKRNSTKWGFFFSNDGGLNFVQRNSGLDGNSIFSLAVDPINTSHVVAGMIGGGIYVTDDAGQTWVRRSSGIHATDSLGFAEDPANSQHLLVSSTEGMNGTPGVYESTNGGGSWTPVGSLDFDVMSFDISPLDSTSILAGTFSPYVGRPGIYRSANGTSGPWSAVLTKAVRVDRFVKYPDDPQKIWAIAVDYVNCTAAVPCEDGAVSATAADLGLYFSDNGGSNWTLRFAGPIADLAAHPTRTNEFVAAGNDVYATTDAFATAPISLGLAAFAPGRFFTSVAFDPGNPSLLLVGTLTGELYRTINYDPSGSGIIWQNIATPATGVNFRSIIIAPETPGVWYVSAGSYDIEATAQSTPGVLRSEDSGKTWTWLDQGLYPSRLVWRLHKSAVNGRMYAAMWGGGLMRLDD